MSFVIVCGKAFQTLDLGFDHSAHPHAKQQEHAEFEQQWLAGAGLHASILRPGTGLLHSVQAFFRREGLKAANRIKCLDDLNGVADMKPRPFVAQCLMAVSLSSLPIAYAGCRADSPSVAPTTPAESKKSGDTRLTRDQVVQMAKEFATQRGTDLQGYPEPTPTFKQGEWRVSFARHRYPGDHFTVYINDATGEMKFFGGM
jgi:hypothetical protein